MIDRRRILTAGVTCLAAPLFARFAWADLPDAGVGDGGEAPRLGEACARIVARIGKNHGHMLVVAEADVLAAVDRTYDIRGSSNHGHTVTVTAAEFETLKGGGIVRTTSSRDGHRHRVLVTCAPAVDPPEAKNVCTIEIAGKDEHEFAVTAADLTTKADKTYDIQGVAGHAHAFTLTASDFAKLARGEPVRGYCTAGDDPPHTHLIFVRYAPPKP